MLLTPSIIQLAHTLENHKHTICFSKDVKHIHQKDLDCSFLHRQLQTFSIDFPSNYDVVPQQFYTTLSTLNTTVKVEKIVSKKTSRGPPFFIV